MNNIPASQKNQIKALATNKETILDLQTCKIIDSVVEKTMTMSWLCYQLSFNNQIWCRDSFQEGIGVCQILSSCISSDIVFQRWGGGNPLFLRHRKPKEPN